MLFWAKQPTNIYFLRADESAFSKGVGPTLIAILFGWWSIPFGIIYTIQCLINNLGKDKDKTDEIMNSLYSNLLLTAYEPEEINNKYLASQPQEIQNESLTGEPLYCKYCGKEFPNYAVYCKYCGKQIN